MASTQQKIIDEPMPEDTIYEDTSDGDDFDEDDFDVVEVIYKGESHYMDERGYLYTRNCEKIGRVDKTDPKAWDLEEVKVSIV